MATVRELRRKPIGGLTVEDMRLLLRQDVGLAYLLPLAVEILRIDPLAEADMCEGDLLAAVLTRSAEVWSEFPELERDVRLIVPELADVPPVLKREVEGGFGSVARRQQLQTRRPARAPTLEAAWPGSGGGPFAAPPESPSTPSTRASRAARREHAPDAARSPFG
jgi:CDI immunity proteins